jgi:phenylacetate-CoA ligase
MHLNFRGRSQNINGYADQPFTFVDPDAHNVMAQIASIDMIENGDRRSREYWQKKQLGNLVNHAYLRSDFWRQRIPSGAGRQEVLQNFPVLSRRDIAAQVETEGSLSGDKKATQTYETTGSTGTPLKVFVAPQNGFYNSVRSIAQFFFDDLPLDENRVEINSAARSDDLEKAVVYKTASSWAGPLSRIYQNGTNKALGFNRADVAGLVEELSRDRVGYLVCHSRVFEQILQYGGLDLIKRLGIKVWFHKSDFRSDDVVEELKKIGVASLSNYSAGELGPIGFECRAHKGHFHVTTTNVIVECDQKVTTTFDGETICRLLITHLHSHATPIIRYDIGDFGKLHQTCPCGHDGPAISHIYGRGKHFLRHPDGTYLPFYLTAGLLREAVEFSECRFRQDAIDTITAEIGGRETLSPEEEDKLRAIITAVTDPAFKVEIKPVKEIDWSDNPKQLFFSSSVSSD